MKEAVKPKFLLALTTTHKAHWRDKINEIDELNLEQVALFPTCLELAERKEFYQLLENTKLKSVPFTHLRTDCELWEIEYLIKRYDCKIFNIHADNLAQGFLDRCYKYRQMIYIENGEHYQINSHFEKTLDQVAGLCIDFSHWEDYETRQDLKNYRNFKKYVDKYKVGCAHISAMKDKSYKSLDLDGNKFQFFACHFMEEISEFDYMKDYLQYLPEYSAIEIENPFSEQLKVKGYLEKMITKSKGAE